MLHVYLRAVAIDLGRSVWPGSKRDQGTKVEMAKQWWTEQVEKPPHDSPWCWQCGGTGRAILLRVNERTYTQPFDIERIREQFGLIHMRLATCKICEGAGHRKTEVALEREAESNTKEWMDFAWSHSVVVPHELQGKSEPEVNP